MNEAIRARVTSVMPVIPAILLKVGLLSFSITLTPIKIAATPNNMAGICFKTPVTKKPVSKLPKNMIQPGRISHFGNLNLTSRIHDRC